MRRLFERLGDLGLAIALMFAAFCLLGRLFWVFELFTHYQPYWALNALLVAGLLFVAKCPLRALACVGLAVFFGWQFVPYYFPRAASAEAERAARVMHYNVLHSNKNFAAVRDYLVEQEADVVMIQEFNTTWQRELEAFIASYPYRQLQPARGATGMALLSKFPLEGVGWGPISQDGWPVMRALVKLPAGDLDLLSIHPPPPVRQRSARVRNACLEAVVDYKPASPARVVLGDFNCAPWSPYFRALVRDTGLLDTALGRGISPTWDLAPGLAIPIDHVLHSEELRVLSREVGPSLGSDHRAVTVDFSF